MEDSTTAAHLHHALVQTLSRRIVHLRRFDSLLRHTFESEGERPLVGSVFPDSDALRAMLDRLSTISSTESAVEDWVFGGIKMLEGEISGRTKQFQPLGESSSTVVEETPAVEAETDDVDEAQGEDGHTSPPLSPNIAGPSSFPDE